MPYYDKFVRMVNGGDLESDKNLDYYKEQSAAADSSGQQSGDSFLPNLTSWANAAANFIAPGRAEALAQYPTYNGGYVKPWDVWGETTQQRFKKECSRISTRYRLWDGLCRRRGERHGLSTFARWD